MNSINIESSNYQEIKKYYDEILNTDKSTYKSSNDEPTPIDCVYEMISKIPNDFWKKELCILDPCCGNGNFYVPILFELFKHHSRKKVLEEMLEFNDINETRLNNVKNVFCNNKYNLKISNNDFLNFENSKKYDLIVANPPYAKILENGKRAAKNHNLIKDFIEKSLEQLKPKGLLLFITPDNWMSFADRNTVVSKLTSLQILHLDIHTSKKYFKNIGSTFTWYLVQNCPYYKNIEISGIYNKKCYNSSVESIQRYYIPLFYNNLVYSILKKTIDNTELLKFQVETSSDLHKYTKRDYIQVDNDEIYKYKLIHTPKQTVYASRPHKYQNGYKVFISTTDKYKVFVDNCGMTQSIAFIRCENENQANQYKKILEHPIYVFINNICRWGNFNNVRILQRFPIAIDYDNIYEYFNITLDEINCIKDNLKS